MMVALTVFVMPFAVGVGLGLLYFGGLWLTMRALPRCGQPALLVFASYFGRMAAAFTVFILIALSGRWESIAVCLLGFLLVKLAMIRQLRPGRGGPGPLRGVEDGNQS